MKKFFIPLLIAILCLFSASPAFSDTLEIDAAAAILIDAQTGKVLFQQNSNQALPPASITKMLTALVALEKGTLDQEITVPADFENAGESGIWLKAGETHTLEDLLYALLLRSANDAAQVIAVGIAGSEEAFVALMNEKMQELGLTGSTWKNVHGLYEDGHLTSAYDLAMISKTALENPTFRTIVATKEYKMPWPGNPVERELFNRNQFLSTYEGAIGIKTGQTSQSGSCLSAAVTRDNLTLIGIVLNSDEMYNQMAKMMDYGFEQYEMKQIGAAGDILGQVQVNAGWDKEINAVLPRNVYMIRDRSKQGEIDSRIILEDSIDAPFKKGEVIGRIIYDDGEGAAVEAELVAQADMTRYTFWGIIKDAFSQIFRVLLF